jgi:signal transduction histidine kinase
LILLDYYFEIVIKPYEQRIRNLKEELEPKKTEIIADDEEISKRIIQIINKSEYLCIYSVIGGDLQFSYINFFYAIGEILEKQRNGDHKGIRWITSINDDNDVELVKILLYEGVQIRHIYNKPFVNFVSSNNLFASTIEKKDEGGKIITSLLSSNDSIYLDHYNAIFEEQWKAGIDAEERIKDIEEGMDYDIKVLRHPNRVWDLYLDLIKSAQSEIFFIFPTPAAFIRQIKPIYLAKLVSRDRKAKIRILTPSNELVEESINRLVEDDDADEEERANKIDQKNLKLDMDYFFDIDIKIRFIEKMSNTKATIVVVDRKHFLVMELKDDAKNSFAQTIGQSIHSTSKAGVLSYVAIFENLWRQSELNLEIKESNEKLKNNDKMQKEFINTAAHELRTPLQPIISLSQLLKDKIKDKEQKGLLDIIIKNAKRLKGLTEDILDVTKIEGDKLNLNKSAFDIVYLLQSLIKEFEHGVEDDKKIKFEMQLNIDSNTIVFADRNRISQVISNLIDNSIKFMAMKDEKGLISIYVEKTKIISKENENSNSFTDEVIISIKDNGKGVDSEIFPRLFTKFASNSFQGTGLGLFIAKNIVEAHAGKIWAKNNEDGESGATFFFSLPLATQQQFM